VAIVGWQAPHTLGRRLVEEQPEVRIFGEMYQRRAEVYVINGFSAHADRAELLAWFDQINNPNLKHAFVVHGEPESTQALGEALEEQHVPHVLAPEPEASVTI
jgi:metallo-beta-lactamase family protein